MADSMPPTMTGNTLRWTLPESSYSELIEDVEWGYNPGHEQLPQINLCMMAGETSRLPVHQTVYAGSHKDVRTLAASLSRFEAATGRRPVTIFMDKGFFSAKTNMITSAMNADVSGLCPAPSMPEARKREDPFPKDKDVLRALCQETFQNHASLPP